MAYGENPTSNNLQVKVAGVFAGCAAPTDWISR